MKFLLNKQIDIREREIMCGDIFIIFNESCILLSLSPLYLFQREIKEVTNRIILIIL
jgi:hypothetical protein